MKFCDCRGMSSFPKTEKAGEYRKVQVCCGVLRCAAEWNQGEASEVESLRGTRSQVLTLNLLNPESEHLPEYCPLGPSLFHPGASLGTPSLLSPELMF